MKTNVEFETLVESLSRSSDGSFVGPQDESRICDAEETLSLKFPPSYRRFVKELGSGDVAGLEILGLVPGGLDVPSVPNTVWLTREMRRQIAISPALLLVAEGGDGTFVAIDTAIRSSDRESPVVRLAVDGRVIERVAPNFAEYLVRELEWRR